MPQNTQLLMLVSSYGDAEGSSRSHWFLEPDIAIYQQVFINEKDIFNQWIEY